MRLFRISPIGLQDLLVVIATFSLLLLQMQTFAADPGVGWHLATGRLTSATGEVPHYDPFLYATAPRPWISDQWLSDLIFFKVLQLGSWHLLYAILTVIFIVTFFGVVYWAAALETGNLLISSFASLFAFKAAQIHFILRPSMLGFLCFACLYFLLYRARRDERIYARLPVLLPVLFLLWANLHPSFVLGLMLLSLLPLEAMCRAFLLPSEPGTLGTFKRGLLLLLVAIIATLFNPFGYELHRSIFSLGNSRFFMDYHSEWLSPNFKEIEGQIFEWFIGVLFVAHCLPGEKRVQLRLGEILGLLLFGHLALQAVRIIPYFLIFASIPFVRSLEACARACQVLWPSLSSTVELAVVRIQARELRAGGGRRTLGFFILLILGSAAFLHRIPIFDGSYGLASTHIPVDAIEFLRGSAQTERAVYRVAAGPDYGGAITWIGEGSLQALIDDRNTLIGEKFYKDFIAHFHPTLDQPREWSGYFSGLGATHLLLGISSPLAVIAQAQGTKELYRDKKAVVFKLEGSPAGVQESQ